MGPAGGLRGRTASRGSLLGDATALGLFGALTADGRGPAVGAVEVPAPDVEAAASLVPTLTVVPSEAEPGVGLHGWAVAHYVADGSGDHAYLIGHAQTIQSLREQLRRAGPAAHGGS